MIENLRKNLNHQISIRDNEKTNLESLSNRLKILKFQKRIADQAQLVIQTVAKQTQKQLEYHISELVSLALQSVFERDYKLTLSYETKREKTEVYFFLEEDGRLVDPLYGCGGGVIDIISFALRISLHSLSNKTDKVIILDEPFRFLSSDLQSKAGEMLKELSEKLGLQVIMVSHIKPLIEQSDHVFEINRAERVSKVEKIK